MVLIWAVKVCPRDVVWGGPIVGTWKQKHQEKFQPSWGRVMSSKIHQGDQALTWERGLAHIHVGPQMKKDGEGMLTPCPALCPWDLWFAGCMATGHHRDTAQVSLGNDIPP